VEWKKLLMGSCKAFFLQVQQNFISHLKLVWHLVLIMALACTWHWTSTKYLNLLVDVLDSFNELGGFVGFGLSMG
jgi:hypothetical protein